MRKRASISYAAYVRAPTDKDREDSSDELLQTARRNECSQGLTVCLSFRGLQDLRLSSPHAQSAGLLIPVNTR